MRACGSQERPAYFLFLLSFSCSADHERECIVIIYSRVSIKRVRRLSILLVVSCTGNRYFTVMSPCSRLIIWPRVMSSAVPSCVSLLIPHTQAESGACSRDSSRGSAAAWTCWRVK